VTPALLRLLRVHPRLVSVCRHAGEMGGKVPAIRGFSRENWGARLTSESPSARTDEPSPSIGTSNEGMHMSVSGDTPTSVYRYYDKFGVLLYVGITSRGISRNIEHNTSKAWWQYVHRQEVDHMPTRKAALDHEKGLIRKFSPPFNVVHNPDHAALREAYGKVRERLTEGRSPRAAYKRVKGHISLVASTWNPILNQREFVSHPEDAAITQLLRHRGGVRVTGDKPGTVASVMAVRHRDGRVEVVVQAKWLSSATGATVKLCKVDNVFEIDEMAVSLFRNHA
jgi:hypothetical protein